MRSLAVIVFAACARSSTAPPVASPNPPPSVAASVCTVDASYWIDSEPIDPQAPITIVIGDNGWGGGADRPALAVWPDGEVLDAGKIGHVPPARATAIAHSVADALRDVPPRISLTDAFDMPSTLIAARDGTRWRVVRVEGLAFRGTQGVASVRAANGRPDRPAPDAIARALGALDALDSVPRPTDYTPAALVLDVQRIPPNSGFAEEWPGAPLDWPANWPAPPQTQTGDPFELIVPGKLSSEVEAFARRMAESRRPVRIRDEHWMFYVRERFRGEVAVGTAAECADTEFVKRWHVANPR
jgi:hypothetical protein